MTEATTRKWNGSLIRHIFLVYLLGLLISSESGVMAFNERWYVDISSSIGLQGCYSQEWGYSLPELWMLMEGKFSPGKTSHVLLSLEIQAGYKTSQGLKNSLASPRLKGPRTTFSLITFFPFAMTESHLS